MASNPLSRRSFLQLSAAGIGPLLFAHAEASEVSGQRSVILIRLAGGNDPYNTLVPIGRADEFREYSAARKTLAILPGTVRRLSRAPDYGFHPALRALSRRFDAGQVLVIRGLEVPAERLSHYEKICACVTGAASSEGISGGWVCEALKQAGGSAHALCFDHEFAAIYRAAFPGAPQPPEADEPWIFTSLQTQVRATLEGLRSAAPPRICLLQHAGFDTHSDQAACHAARLAELDEALQWLCSELERAGRQDNVSLLVYSEFGRSFCENNSGGTEHGPASLGIVLGPNLVSEIMEPLPGQCIDLKSVIASLVSWMLGRPVEIHREPAPLLPIFHAGPAAWIV